jgi:hypothetical protein
MVQELLQLSELIFVRGKLNELTRAVSVNDVVVGDVAYVPTQAAYPDGEFMVIGIGRKKRFLMVRQANMR